MIHIHSKNETVQKTKMLIKIEKIKSEIKVI